MRFMGWAIVRANRLSEEFWRGFRLGHKTGRAYALSMLKRPAETGDTAAIQQILRDVACCDPTDVKQLHVAVERGA